VAQPADLVRVGVVVNRVCGVDAITRAADRIEELGYGAAWLTHGGPEDAMAVLPVLAIRTSRIKLGTSVIQTYPRHPYVLAGEANVIDQLAPGRLRLGIGPSHAAVLQALGIERTDPFGHTAEYLQILRSLFAGQRVEFAGQHYRVQAAIGRLVNVPVMVGSLQPKTFELAGAQSDGAITWLCPPAYLARHALPGLQRGADGAGRARPPLIAHIAACVHDNADEVREAVRQTIPNIRFPAYQRMLTRAGYPDAGGGAWTDALIDQVMAWGRPETVAYRVRELLDLGCDEVLVRPIAAGPDGDLVTRRTLESIAALLLC
jgi:probable F420-dependent oxidoreductase